MLDQKFSQSEIARRLGRDRAMISREIRRNYGPDSEFLDADGHWAMTANDTGATGAGASAGSIVERICEPRSSTSSEMVGLLSR